MVKRERAHARRKGGVFESLRRVEFHVPFSLPALFARRGTAFWARVTRALTGDHGDRKRMHHVAEALSKLRSVIGIATEVTELCAIERHRPFEPPVKYREIETRVALRDI